MTNTKAPQKAICYIRVSDKVRGDDETQRSAIMEYCKKQGLVVIDVLTEFVSASKTDVKDRLLLQAVNDMPKDCALVMTDITRLGRRKVFDLLGVVGLIVAKGELHLAYTERIVNAANSDDAETIFTLVGGSYAAVDEAKKRSQRAKAAHARRKKAGLLVGRKKGTTTKSKLDKYSFEISSALRDGANISQLAIQLECSRAQLYRWINRNIKKELNGQQSLAV